MKAIELLFHDWCCVSRLSFVFMFILQIAAVANSTEYRLGLTKNANMTGKLLAGVANLQMKAFEINPCLRWA